MPNNPPGKLRDCHGKIKELSDKGYPPALIQENDEVQQMIEEVFSYKDLVRFRARHEASLIETQTRVRGGGRENFLLPTDLLSDADKAELPIEVLEHGIAVRNPGKLTYESETRVLLYLLEKLLRSFKSFTRSIKRGELYDLAQQLELFLPALIGVLRASLNLRRTGTNNQPGI